VLANGSSGNNRSQVPAPPRNKLLCANAPTPDHTAVARSPTDCTGGRTRTREECPARMNQFDGIYTGGRA
jgi:hypothetical protein